MEINNICLDCKKLCKKLENEDVKNCKNYDPLPSKGKKEDHKIKSHTIVINKRH